MILKPLLSLHLEYLLGAQTSATSLFTAIIIITIMQVYKHPCLYFVKVNISHSYKQGCSGEIYVHGKIKQREKLAATGSKPGHIG